jgi:citronellol/citronellal dehydrogenase
MSMLTLGMSEEFAAYRISVNSLWPQTMIATAAIEFQLGNRESFKQARTPAIMADAAHVILDSRDRQITGRLLIDEEILRESGVTEFNHYRFDRESEAALMPDLFVD